MIGLPDIAEIPPEALDAMPRSQRLELVEALPSLPTSLRHQQPLEFL